MSKHVLLALVVASLLLSACVAPAPPAAPTLEAPATPEATATQLAPAATDAATATPEASAPQAPAALPDDAVAQLDEFLKAQVYTEGADPKTHAPGLVLLDARPGPAGGHARWPLPASHRRRQPGKRYADAGGQPARDRQQQ